VPGIDSGAECRVHGPTGAPGGEVTFRPPSWQPVTVASAVDVARDGGRRVVDGGRAGDARPGFARRLERPPK
jgi:hypothetical protein